MVPFSVLLPQRARRPWGYARGRWCCPPPGSAAAADYAGGVPHPIRAESVLPAHREAVVLGGGLGELSLPVDRPPSSTLVCAVQTDHHVLRKAAWRLPALAGLGVLRTEHAAEAVTYVREHALGEAWLAGWSFGADAVLRLGDLQVAGVVALSPSLGGVEPSHLAAWAESGRGVTVLVAELDDHLRPEEARQRFAAVPQAEVVVLDWASHDWEGDAERVLDEVVRRVAPAVRLPLPTEWDGPVETGVDVPIPRPRAAD